MSDLDDSECFSFRECSTTEDQPTEISIPVQSQTSPEFSSNNEAEESEPEVDDKQEAMAVMNDMAKLGLEFRGLGRPPVSQVCKVKTKSYGNNSRDPNAVTSTSRNNLVDAGAQGNQNIGGERHDYQSCASPEYISNSREESEEQANTVQEAFAFRDSLAMFENLRDPFDRSSPVGAQGSQNKGERLLRWTFSGFSSSKREESGPQADSTPEAPRASGSLKFPLARKGSHANSPSPKVKTKKRSPALTELMNRLSNGKYEESEEADPNRIQQAENTALLAWCQNVTEVFEEVQIRHWDDNSWKDGLAFCAIFKAVYYWFDHEDWEKKFPEFKKLIEDTPFDRLLTKTKEERFILARELARTLKIALVDLDGNFVAERTNCQTIIRAIFEGLGEIKKLKFKGQALDNSWKRWSSLKSNLFF